MVKVTYQGTRGPVVELGGYGPVKAGDTIEVDEKTARDLESDTAIRKQRGEKPMWLVAMTKKTKTPVRPAKEEE